MRYAICDDIGTILGFRDVAEEDLQSYADEILVAVDRNVTEDTHYVENGTAAIKPNRPSEYHDWSMELKAWTLNDTRAWADIRHKRDLLIAETDYMVLPDAPFSVSEVEEIKTYRQALRDITEQPDPVNIIWPNKPEEMI